MRELIGMLLRKPELHQRVNPEHILDENDQLVLKAMYMLSARGIRPDLDSLTLTLTTGNINRPDLVQHMHDRLKIPCNMDPEFVFRSIREDFNRRLLFSLHNEGLRNLNAKDADSQRDLIQERLKEWASHIAAHTMEDTVRQTLDQIKRVQNKEVKAYWRTGWEKYDEMVGMAPRQINVTAAQKKMGKTRFILAKLMNAIKYNPELQIDWFTFEMSEFEMVTCQLSMLTGIDNNRILGKKKPRLSDEEMVTLDKCEPMLRGYPIKWYDRKSTIEQIANVVLKNGTENRVVVLDNLGLIQPSANVHGGDSEIAMDNHVARYMKEFRDESNACIEVIHHLGKGSENKFNKKDFYIPRSVDVRGSSRIVDFCNSLVLLHRVDKYKDLRDEMTADEWERAQGMISVIVDLNRGGEEDIVRMRYDLTRCHFEEVSD